MSLRDMVADPAWLFDVGFPVKRWDKGIDRSAPNSWNLGADYRIAPLKQLSDGAEKSESWMAWSDGEVLLQVQLHHSIPMSAPEVMFSLDFCIDTRYSRGIHRANAYCHLYQYRLRQPFFVPLEHKLVDARPGLISRSRAIPVYNNSNQVRGWLTATPSRLEWKILIPYISLAGCDPAQFPDWGVMWVASDGRKRYSLARNPLHIPLDDPSLWCNARLVESADA